MTRSLSHAARAVLAGAAVCVVLAGFPAGCAARLVQEVAAPVRLDGEYGLFVLRDADTLRVAWLTRAAGAGWAQLVEDGRPGREVTTPVGRGHVVTFVHRGGGPVVLRYGARDDRGDRHETALHRELAPRRPSVAHSGVDSIFVMGDIHGELDRLLSVLRNARVVDAQSRWSAGRAHLVVVGDMLDRGPDATAVLWFLYGLEPQAERAGGSLDVVLGNHEVMVMLADLRYVHPKEQTIAAAHGVLYDRMFDPRRSVLGAWLASRPALLRVGDVLFAHGGVSTDYVGWTLQSFDDTLAAYTGEELFYRWVDSTYAPPLDSAGLARRIGFFQGERSVLWYRGYAQSDTLSAALAQVLAAHGARIHVIGHTPGPTIRERYGGSLIAVNTDPFAAELLLLVRRGDAYDRWRYRSTGPPERLGARP